MVVLNKTYLGLWHKELQTVSGSIQRTLDRPDMTAEERGSPTGMATLYTKARLDDVIAGLGKLVELAGDLSWKSQSGG